VNEGHNRVTRNGGTRPHDPSFSPPAIPVHGDKLGKTAKLSTSFPFLSTGYGTSTPQLAVQPGTSFLIAKPDLLVPPKTLTCSGVK